MGNEINGTVGNGDMNQNGGRKMVRKSTELQSINDLNLSGAVKGYAKKRYGDNIQHLILEVRSAAFKEENWTNPDNTKTMKELISTLDREGFIRHDISFRLNHIIKAITNDTHIVSGVWELGFTFNGDDATFAYEVGNAAYESYQNGSIESFKAYIKQYLEKEEYDIILDRFGLNDGQKPMTLEQVRDKYGFRQIEKVRSIEAIALRKLKRSPAGRFDLFELFLKTEHEQQEFARAMIRQKNHYERIVNEMAGLVSTKASEVAKSYLDNRTTDMFIEEVGFSIKTYNTLKRGGFNTLSQIIDLPKADWGKVRNLGKGSQEEIIEIVKSLTGIDLF